MAELRAVVTSLGHADVATYIQSGNVLFTPAPQTTRRHWPLTWSEPSPTASACRPVPSCFLARNLPAACATTRTGMR